MENSFKPKGTLTAALVINIIQICGLGLTGIIFVATALLAGSITTPELMVAVACCWFLAGLCLIPLAWCIPMTVKVAGQRKRSESPSIAFGVCTLLFVNLISGILLLCTDKD